MDDRPVLVLGATGVFGGMACRLLRRQGVRVVAAGRNRARLDALAAELDLATEAGHSDVAAVLERERTEREREREQVAAALLAELTDGAGTQKGGKQNKGKLVLL